MQTWVEFYGTVDLRPSETEADLSRTWTALLRNEYDISSVLVNHLKNKSFQVVVDLKAVIYKSKPIDDNYAGCVQ